jgi:hypothetical protein
MYNTFIVLIVMICGFALTVFHLALLRNSVSHLYQLYSTHQIADAHEESIQYDLPDAGSIARAEAFDLRIAQIKSDLASQDKTPRSGYPADETHPDVTNLPHNTISDEAKGIPDEEYAE